MVLASGSNWFYQVFKHYPDLDTVLVPSKAVSGLDTVLDYLYANQVSHTLALVLFRISPPLHRCKVMMTMPYYTAQHGLCNVESYKGT